MITVGIDAGAATTKAVLLDDREIRAYRLTRTAFDFRSAAEQIYQDLLLSSDRSVDAIERICATGYGRNSVPFADMTVSEITAHARGVGYLLPDARGIIDVGGQDSKVIALENGQVTDFLMNDRCAAGTGKFLEYTARALEIPLEELGPLATTSAHPSSLSSMCTVFAESEVLSLRAQGIPREDIAAGLVISISQRIATMVRQLRLQEPIAFVGGVAKNIGVRAALEKELGCTLFIPEEPQRTGALGAALVAQHAHETGRKSVRRKTVES